MAFNSTDIDCLSYHSDQSEEGWVGKFEKAADSNNLDSQFIEFLPRKDKGYLQEEVLHDVESAKS